MKKLIAICISASILASCMTTSDVEHHTSPTAAAVWSIIPGAGQYMIGEKKESLWRAASVLAPASVGMILDPASDDPEAETSPAATALAFTALGFWVLTAVDAYQSAGDHYVPGPPRFMPSGSFKLPYQVKRAANDLYIGDTESRVYKLLGRPSDTNVTELGGATLKQLVYYEADVYVYTDNGIVTAIQK